MSNYSDAADGVTQALAETGEQLTIARTVTTSDPNKPTQPPQSVTTEYTCTGYLGPNSRYNPESQQREVSTECYIDPLSVRDDLGDVVNTLGNLTLITEEGDVMTRDNGEQFVLTRAEHAVIEGQIAAFIHTGLA